MRDDVLCLQMPLAGPMAGSPAACRRRFSFSGSPAPFRGSPPCSSVTVVKHICDVLCIVGPVIYHGIVRLVLCLEDIFILEDGFLRAAHSCSFLRHFASTCREVMFSILCKFVAKWFLYRCLWRHRQLVFVCAVA